jgi:O-antigen/teichoic acid export membrane protein
MNNSLEFKLNRIFSWFFLYTFINIFIKGSNSLFIFFLATILTPSEYADFGILFALQAGMTSFGTVGILENTTSRLKTHNSVHRLSVLFRRMSGLTIISMSCSLIALIPFIYILVRVEYNLIAFIAITLGAINSFAIMQAAFLRLENKHSRSLFFNGVIPFCSLLGLSFGVWFTKEIGSIFTFGLVGAFIPLLLLIFKRITYIGPLPRINRSIKESVAFAPFLIMAIFGWLSGYGMNFFIDFKFESKHVASFTLLFTIASICQLLANSLNMVWGPHFYKMFCDKNMVYAEDRNKFFYTLLALTLGITGFILVSLLPLVFNEIGGQLGRYAGFRLELSLLIIGYILCIPWWSGQNYYLVAGYNSEFMRLSIFSGALGLILWISCMLALGPVGIFVGFTFQMVVKSVTMWICCNRHWHLRPPIFSIILACGLVCSGLLF